MKSEKIITLAVLVGLVSGMVGGAFTNEYVISYVFQRFQGDVSPFTKVVEQKTYVEESSGIDAIKKVSPSVVSIVATKDLKVYKNQGFGDPFFDQFFAVPQSNEAPEIKKQKVGGGSGFIVTAEGVVVTNAHVVADASAEYTVVLSEGSEFKAKILGTDTVNDIAFVQIEKDAPQGENSKKISTFSAVEFGDSDDLQVGQKVLAIGYALGEFENTVTSGILSAKGRHITASGGAQGSEELFGLLQTDASINPGNSGGPLINLQGQVIGVDVAMASGQGIGFAIPINDVKPILEGLQKNGKILKAYLGVRHLLLNKENAKELEIEVDHGALLVGDDAKGQFAVVPGSPADKAGLKMRDVILEVAGASISEENSLMRLLRKFKPGDSVALKVWRSGKTMDVTVTLGEQPQTK